jgi:hypothetical protein
VIIAAMSLFRHGNQDGHDGAGSPAHGSMRDPVAGKALVITINSFLEWQTEGFDLRYLYSGPLTATLVVEAEGVPKTTVEHAERVARGDDRILSRWPEQGDTVPVIIDRADPGWVRFDWDQMPTERDKIARMEQKQAELLLRQAYRQPPAKPNHHLP